MSDGHESQVIVTAPSSASSDKQSSAISASANSSGRITDSASTQIGVGQVTNTSGPPGTIQENVNNNLLEVDLPTGKLEVVL